MADDSKRQPSRQQPRYGDHDPIADTRHAQGLSRFCGCCNGPYSLRGANRFVCSGHVTSGSCSNGRTILRDEFEQRVLAGLQGRMMAPEVVAEAMRAYAEETNRLNGERRSNSDAWRSVLAKVE